MFSPTPMSTSRPNRSGVRAANAQEQLRAEREADRIDLTVGERGLNRCVEVVVFGRVVRRGGRPVAEEIDRDHRAARVGEEVDPATGPPTVLERRADSMHEHNGLGPHAHTVRANTERVRGNRERPPFECRGPPL